MNKYEEELKYVKNYLEEELGYKVAYIALYGSQNYNLDINNKDYKSDIDMKAIIVPSLSELINNSNPVSETVTINKKLNEYMIEKVDLKDIREYTKQLVKSNPSYVEIFYTDYYLVDDDFKYDFEFIFDNIDELVYSNRAKMIRAIYGMAKQKEHALTKRFESKEDIIDKYGYDGKQISHIIRLHWMTCVYYGYSSYKKYSFKDAVWLDSSDTQQWDIAYELIELKNSKYSLEYVQDLCNNVIVDLKDLKERILKGIDESKIDYSVKYKIQARVNKIIKNKIIKEIKGELI